MRGLDDRKRTEHRRQHLPVPAVHIDGRAVLPIMSGDRPLGVYVIGDEHVRWYPVAPRGRLALGTALVIAATSAVAVVAASRRDGRRHGSPAEKARDRRGRGLLKSHFCNG